MTLWEAFWLGLLQGITEFLPISSSGHLVLLHAFFGIEEGALSYDVFLHVATLLAVLGYFWRDWVRLLGGGVRMVRARRVDSDGKMLLFIILGTIPAGALGLLIADDLEALFHGAEEGPFRVGLMFLMTGLLFLFAEKLASHTRPMEKMRWRDAGIVGLFQAMALLPGVSRSGATMIGGLFLGLKRADAARFSFLLAAPITGGAALVKVPELLELGQFSVGALVLGFVVSFVSALLCIHYLLKLLQTHTFLPFAWYLIGLGTLTVGIMMYHS